MYKNRHDVLHMIHSINTIISKNIENKMKKYCEKGLVTSHSEILEYLYKNEKATMKDISKFTGRDKSTVTSLIKKLSAGGYVEKISDKKDRRKTFVRLTEKSKKLKQLFLDISTKLDNQTFNGLTDEETNILHILLNKMYKNLEREGE